MRLHRFGQFRLSFEIYLKDSVHSIIKLSTIGFLDFVHAIEDIVLETVSVSVLCRNGGKTPIHLSLLEKANFNNHALFGLKDDEQGPETQ
jgi:hypothetical protein